MTRSRTITAHVRRLAAAAVATASVLAAPAAQATPSPALLSELTQTAAIELHRTDRDGIVRGRGEAWRARSLGPRVDAGPTDFSRRQRTDPLDSYAPARRRARYRSHIDEAARRFNLEPRLVEAVIAVESGFDPRAVSPAGARGLMQLLPPTARDLQVRDSFDPRQNILGGARYLRQLLDRFDGDLTLTVAAYNAGPGRVVRAGGIPRQRETRNYVRKVTALYYAGAPPAAY